MKVGRSIYIVDRKEWRAWLKLHHKKAREIWLIYYKKNSGKPRLPYDAAVEEALCYGWIDSILKPIDKNRYAQRFSPRRKGSNLSELNKERVRRLIRQKKMTCAGLLALDHVMNEVRSKERNVIASDILSLLKSDPVTRKNFSRFPAAYKRIRIGWIEAARQRPEIFQQRLRYFLKMTRLNKRFGSIQN
jgi:uncharacterized protein YdeI (YjbR/CyaY-like superfamily)